jgi:hypothetical protein
VQVRGSSWRVVVVHDLKKLVLFLDIFLNLLSTSSFANATSLHQRHKTNYRKVSYLKRLKEDIVDIFSRRGK